MGHGRSTDVKQLQGHHVPVEWHTDHQRDLLRGLGCGLLQIEAPRVRTVLPSPKYGEDPKVLGLRVSTTYHQHQQEGIVYTCLCQVYAPSPGMRAVTSGFQCCCFEMISWHCVACLVDGFYIPKLGMWNHNVNVWCVIMCTHMSTDMRIYVYRYVPAWIHVYI